MDKDSSRPTGRYFTALIVIAAIFVASLVFTGQASAAQSDTVATRLLGKPVDQMREHLDSVRNRPSHQSELSKTFDERDHYRKGATASLSGDDKTSMFFDMRHEIDQENETWHGSAGVQIVW
ncbi:hypothetical protein C4J81_03635 [Deltaproteobacteria bacterium Smac51]|nr:hypothetical protein C4J81_03635 [Deltaproteobacteria bacterium Smac51]